jgi:orotidine-5'-phosphate decarboxylase
VIIACDFGTRAELMDFLSLFNDCDNKPYVKIGMEAFYANGPEIVREIKGMGHNIFLDLKLHDIPNTVGRAMKVLSDLHVDMVNIHAAGGSAMMQAAKESLMEKSPDTILLAVTQLTSTSEEMMHRELLIDSNHTMEDTVIGYARNAASSGCNGVVCSPLEAGIVKKACGKDFITVTPGIRFSDDSKGDQKRVTTPYDAMKLGSDYIVVGRSITGAKDPVEAYQRAVSEFIG